MDTNEILRGEINGLRKRQHEMAGHAQADKLKLELSIKAHESNAAGLKKVEGEMKELKEELFALRLEFKGMQTRVAIFTGLAVFLATGLWEVIGKHVLK